MTLEHFVLDKAENPPSDWHNEIRDAAPSIRWTDNVRGDLASRIGAGSSQVDGLATKLDQYSPEPTTPEPTHAVAASPEQDLRLRTTAKATSRATQQPSK